MRVDKFLKVSRLIKRRTIAKEACEKDRIMINGKIAKPGSELRLGDVVTIQYGNTTINAKVNLLSEHCPKDQAESMYEIVD
ncbi:MAG: RNA-binding S4 domain-containing protein [Eubacteriales bacterium]